MPDEHYAARSHSGLTAPDCVGAWSTTACASPGARASARICTRIRWCTSSRSSRILAVLRLAGARAGPALRPGLLPDSQAQFRREKRRPSPAAARSRPAPSATRRTIATRWTTAARYVLGWSNKEKIAAPGAAQAAQLESAIAEPGRPSHRAPAGRAEGQLRRTLDAWSNRLDEYRDFAELDWQPLVRAEVDRGSRTRKLRRVGDGLQTCCRR